MGGTPFTPSPEMMGVVEDALARESEERSGMFIGTTTAPDGRKVLRRQSAGRGTGWHSLLGLRYRIQTKTQADELRLDYRRFFESYVERTDRSERRNLLDLEHRTVGGVYRYAVEDVRRWLMLFETENGITDEELDEWVERKTVRQQRRNENAK